MLNLGDIEFGLGVDTSSLGRSVRQVQQFGNAVSAAAASSAAGARAAEAALRRQEAASLSALQATLRFNQEARRMHVPKDMLNQSSAAFGLLSQRMTQGRLTNLEYQRAMEDFTARMGKAKRALADFDPAPSGSKFKVWLQDMTSSATIALGPLSGVGARITALSGIMGRSSIVATAFFASIAAGAFAFYKLGSSAVSVEMDIQRIEARLQGLSRSSAEARADFKRLGDIADQTGNDFRILAEQWTLIKAAAKNTSMEGEKSWEMFQNISVAAAAFRLNGVQVEATFKAISQMMSKGTVQLEELKGQLGDQLPIAMQAAAQAMGVTTKELNKMIRAGKVSSEEFLVPFSRAIAKILGVDPSKEVDSLVASFGRLQNAYTRFNMAMDQQFGFSSAFKSAVDAAAGALNWISTHLSDITKWAAMAGAAMIGLVAPNIISGFITLAAAIVRATISMAAFQLLASGGLGLVRVVAAVGLALGAMYAFDQMAMNSAQNLQSSLIASVDEYIKAQEGLKAHSKSTTASLINDVDLQIKALELQVNAALTARQALVRESQETDWGGMSKSDWAHKKAQEGNKMLKAIFGDGWTTGDSAWLESIFPTSTQQADQQTSSLDNLSMALETLRTQMTKLKDIANKPDWGEIVPPQNDTDELSKRAKKANREALDAIYQLQNEALAMSGGPAWYEEFKKQDEINQKIINFRQRLEDAGLPLAKIKTLTEQFALAQYQLRDSMEGSFAGLTALRDIFSDTLLTSLQGVSDAFANMVVESEWSLDSLVDVAKTATKKIINELMTLTLINPIMNSLFGQTNPTLAGVGENSGGLGGLLSKIFGGVGKTGAPNGGGFSGVMGSLFGSLFTGFAAKGASLGTGEMAIAGEGGVPELVTGPAKIHPGGQGGNLYITNNSREVIRAKKRSDGRGWDVQVGDMVAGQMARSGSSAYNAIMSAGMLEEV